MKQVLTEYRIILNEKTCSEEQIASHHNISLERVCSQLEVGIEMEKEHTSIERIAKEIALDNLLEDPEYYTKLLENQK